MTIDLDQRVVEEFRSNRGRVSGPLAGSRLLLLSTRGGDGGQRRTTPVEFVHDGGRRTLIVAVPDRAGALPGWYEDLRAGSRVGVENGVFTLEAEAVTLDGAEREEIFARLVEAEPGLAEAQDRLGAPIPVVALNPVSGRPSGSSWSEDLKLIHDAFRRELALIRTELAGAGPSLGAQLRINCLTLCGGLGHHHTSEDAQMLPVVGEHHPELAGVIAELRAEHEAMAKLLAELQAVISADRPDTAQVRAEVERLTAQVEAHLDHEEAELLPLLDALAPN
ncbi:nitroreductase/quinone reductase family protein [Micromonospora sp. NPDC002296]|uniref:nitroreductase/quinone reductase family protein n=1 Tax=Micromonospora sp. NPDC002296 TaxID=3154271 RepID=UPI00332BCF38